MRVVTDRLALEFSRATGDDVIRIRATATIKKNGKNEYTQLAFTRAK